MLHDKPFSNDIFLLANFLVTAVFRSDDGLAAAESQPTEEETTGRGREGAAAKCSLRSKRRWPLPDRLHLPPCSAFVQSKSVSSAVHLHACLRKTHQPFNPSHCRQQHSKIKNKKTTTVYFKKINLTACATQLLSFVTMRTFYKTSVQHVTELIFFFLLSCEIIRVV